MVILAEAICSSISLGSGLVMWEPQLGALEPRCQAVRHDMRSHGKAMYRRKDEAETLAFSDTTGIEGVLCE